MSSEVPVTSHWSPCGPTMLMAARMASRPFSRAASRFCRLSTSPFGVIERRDPSLRCEVPTVTLPSVRLVGWRGWCRRDRVFLLLVVALLFAVTLRTRPTTSGLRWPLDIDLYRDIVQATSVRNGHIFADANYAGETAWYNPLLGWIVAIGSIVTRQSVATFATQGGVRRMISPRSAFEPAASSSASTFALKPAEYTFAVGRTSGSGRDITSTVVVDISPSHLSPYSR
jgi:hypothetical protein